MEPSDAVQGRARIMEGARTRCVKLAHSEAPETTHVVRLPLPRDALCALRSARPEEALKPIPENIRDMRSGCHTCAELLVLPLRLRGSLPKSRLKFNRAISMDLL